MTARDKRNVKRLATEFRQGFLGRQSSDRMCFAVCFPLQGFLSTCGYQTELVTVDFPATDHVWLQFQDGTIVDPTADQFKGFPKVYVGPVPRKYVTWQRQAALDDLACLERRVG